MLSTLLLAICFVGGNLALDENEWRDVAVELYYKITKYVGQHDYDQFADLFRDDSVELFPDGSPFGKRGLKPIMEKLSISSEYLGFMELLYSSPDVAVTRHAAFRTGTDRTMARLKGVFLLVREKGEVRIGMVAFDSD